VATVSAAAAALGAGPDALAEAESSGLVHVEGGFLQLRHPLVRSAIYTAATSVDRRRAHAALAAVLVHDEDADRRAWHLAASVDEADDAVVAELDTAAARADNRGGHEAAAAAWERAAELSADPTERAQRLYRAARGAWLAGQPSRARPLAEAARDVATDPALRADAVRLRARIEWNTGSVRLGHRMVLEGARDVAPHDPSRAREMAMFAAALAAFGGDSGIDIDPADFSAFPGADAPARQRCFAQLLIGLASVTAGAWVDANTSLRQAFATARELQLGDQDLLPNLAIAALHLGDFKAADDYHQQLLTRARDTGAVVMVLYSLTRLGFSDIATGQWSAAVGRQREALKLGEGTGQPVLAAAPLAWLLLLSAFRGDAAYDTQLKEVESVLEAQSLGTLDVLLRDITRWAKGLHAGPRIPAGFHHLAQIAHPMVQRTAGIDRVEAAVHAGQQQTAQLWIDDLDTFGRATDQSWASAAAAHGRAVLAGTTASTGVPADSLFEQALELHSRSPRRFDVARTRLAYGEHLRRTRRRVAARNHLRTALGTFEELRAGPWADRAAQELRASGESPRKRDASTNTDLTPQELQVAQLVRRGLSNRDVAAQLFVSPRTVDFHLRNVFAKKGVASRAELGQLQLG
jgi:DNA-binding CsgD family transcriptional regulator